MWACIIFSAVLALAHGHLDYVSLEEVSTLGTDADRLFKVGQGPHHTHVHLTKIDANDHPITVVSGEEDGDKFSTSFVQNGDTYYVNAADGHSVVINDAGPSPTMHGILNGTQHIGAAKGTEHRLRRDADLTNPHFLEPRKETEDDYAGFLRDERFKDEQKTRDKRQATSPPSYVFPEVYAVVDYNLYTTLARSEYEVVQYIRVVYNGVNNVYSQLTNPSYVIRLAGVYICKAASSCFFIENIKSNGMVNADSALGGIDSWAYTQLGTFGLFDLMMVHTSLDLCTGSGTSCSSTSVAGLATVEGACDKGRPGSKTIKNAGISEDEGAYNGIKTIAHEMGHLLGAVHDGERAANSQQQGAPGASSCPWDSNYIMGNAGFSINQFSWSTCSKRQLQFFARSTDGQCLWNNLPAPRPQYTLLNQLPGKILTYDQQCKILFGSQAKECPSSSSSTTSNDQKCLAVKCQVSGNRFSWSCRSVSNPPADGTTCATGKYCLEGRCVCDPTVNSNCPTSSVQSAHTPPPNLPAISKDTPTDVYCVDDAGISWGGKGCAEVVATYWDRQTYCNSASFNKYCCQSKKKCTNSEAPPCEDNAGITFNGMSCSQLLSGSYWNIKGYCGQSNVETHCCASHKQNCNKSCTTDNPSYRPTTTKTCSSLLRSDTAYCSYSVIQRNCCGSYNQYCLGNSAGK